MKIIKYTTLLLLCITAVCNTSCEKFLDAKPEQGVVIPKSLDDLQALLDANLHLNMGNYSGLLEVGVDDYVVDYTLLGYLTDFEQASYRWDPAPYYLQFDINVLYKNPYFPILVANTVLDEWNNLNVKSGEKADMVRGEALFHRAFSFFHLAQVFCPPYDPATAATDLGIPLRLSPDFNEKSTRATVQETYDQIIQDFNAAAELLPITTEYKTRPCKVAAYAAMARMYLAMERYKEAADYADKALGLYHALMDYNAIDVDATFPFEMMNEETIFVAYSGGFNMLSPRYADVNPQLYQQYADNDLRKWAFFDYKSADHYGYKGSYTGMTSGTFFMGLAVDELYLIRAECSARAGKKEQAMDDLNHLLQYRWKQGTFEALTAANAEDALQLIIQERRKELLFRGVRWSDLRRLNRDERFATTLVRSIANGDTVETFTLPPNDLRYTYLFPQEVIRITGMQQNSR